MPIQPTDIDIIVPVLRQRAENLKKRAKAPTLQDIPGPNRIMARELVKFLAREFEHLADALMTAQQATQSLNTELKKKEKQDDEQS